MRQLATILCLATLTTRAFAAEPGAAKAPTTELRCETLERGIFKADVANNLRNGNFDWLERTADALIKDDPRYSSGISKLVDFYGVLDPSDGDGPEGADARVATFTAWQKAFPSSHWPKVGFSAVELWRGSQARGTRWASEATREQWAEHDRHLTLAMEWGKKALADDAGDPEIFTHMIYVCRRADCSQEQAESWLAAALAVNPKYDAVYIAMATFLVPRWRGSPDAFVDFAEKASDANKDLGNIVYSRIAVVALGVDGDKIREIYPRLSWDRIENGLRQMNRRYPDSTRTYHLLARFAYLYGDRAVAQEAFSRLTNGWRSDVQYWGAPAAFKKAYAWAMDGEPGPF
jgi:hypothetical protein